MARGRDRRLRAILQIALALVVLGFLVAAIAGQWDELRDRDVRFAPVWLLAAIPILFAFYALAAFGWNLLLGALGHRLPEARAQSVWAQSLLARYVPGGVLMVLGRVVLAAREGVPRRITLASLVYEASLLIASATIIAGYFVVTSALGAAAKVAILAVVPLVVAALHPRVFGPISAAVLRRVGRDPLPVLIPLQSVVALLGFFTALWVVGGAGVFFAGLTVYPLEAGDLPLVSASHAVGFSAAAVLVVFPGGLGIRDATFASLAGSSLPGGFATGATIAIAARLLSSLVEVAYAAAAVSLARAFRAAT